MRCCTTAGEACPALGANCAPVLCTGSTRTTSGLLVVAKNDAAHQGLAAQMAVHSIERAYHAVAYGGFRQDEGFVEAPIGRHKTDRKKMAIVPDGRYAYTAYRVVDRTRDSPTWSAACAPAVPIRSGCIWPASGILWRAIRYTAPKR